MGKNRHKLCSAYFTITFVNLILKFLTSYCTLAILLVVDFLDLAHGAILELTKQEMNKLNNFIEIV